MEATQVIGKILADARGEAERIAQQASEQQAAEQAKVDEELKGYAEQTKVLAEKAAADEKSHLLAAARMEIAKEYLAEKRRILDGVFEQARASLEGLSDEEYRKLMIKLMAEAVETGDEEVVVGRDEKRIDQNLIEQVNKQLDAERKGKLKLSSKADEDLGGGFVLRRGKIRTNVSIDILLEQARKELEIELAKDLFSSLGAGKSG